MTRPTRRRPSARRPFPRPPRAVPPSAPVEVDDSYRLYTKQQVLAIVGVSYVTLWGWIKTGHFPASIVVGPEGGHRSTRRWIAKEVHAWIANRPRRLPRGSTASVTQ
jgi:predicted DNA-binding transcriptional regulator AlpA